MAAHNDLGSAGEQLAADWLTVKGYEILHRNWKQGPCELDIIARYKDVYHFIEVKTGHANRFGNPEERVGKAKIRNWMRCASSWLFQRNIPASIRVQYDVLAITIPDNGPPDYFFTEDVSL